MAFEEVGIGLPNSAAFDGNLGDTGAALRQFKHIAYLNGFAWMGTIVGVDLLGGGGISVRTHRGDFAAAIDVSENMGGAAIGLRDFDLGVLHQAKFLALGPFVHQRALAASVNVTDTIYGMAYLVFVADGASGNVDGDVAVVVGLHRTVFVCSLVSKVGAYSGHTATAEHRTENLGVALDVQFNIAADDACREREGRETTAASEGIAVNAGSAEGAYDTIVPVGSGIATDGGGGVAQDMAVLTAAEDGAEDHGIAPNGDFRRTHVGPFVEHDTRVAHAGAEDVAVDGTSLDACKGARHTDGAA